MFTKIAVFFKPIFCENFEIAAVQKYANDVNLVKLEKCCQTHIFLENFVLIQPRTSPPKICKKLYNANFAQPEVPEAASGSLPFAPLVLWRLDERAGTFTELCGDADLPRPILDTCGAMFVLTRSQNGILSTK